MYLEVVQPRHCCADSQDQVEMGLAVVILVCMWVMGDPKRSEAGEEGVLESSNVCLKKRRLPVKHDGDLEINEIGCQDHDEFNGQDVASLKETTSVSIWDGKVETGDKLFDVIIVAVRESHVATIVVGAVVEGRQTFG